MFDFRVQLMNRQLMSVSQSNQGGNLKQDWTNSMSTQNYFPLKLQLLYCTTEKQREVILLCTCYVQLHISKFRVEV